MFTKNDVRRALGIDCAISDEMQNAMQLWIDLYENRQQRTNETEKSLSLPAGIASEMARLVTLELKSELSGSVRAEYLNDTYRGILRSVRRYTEYACAMGGLVLKPYFDGEKIQVDYVQPGAFFPTEFDVSGRILGAVFLDKVIQGKKIYTRLEYAQLRGDIYTVRNSAYVSENKDYLGSPVSLGAVERWSQLQEETVIRGLKKPLFVYFKMPQANTVDTLSPLGVSVYARAVDLIDEADKQYNRLLWEFESGERALYVSDEAFKKGKDGKPIFPDRRLYRSIATFGGKDGDVLFEDWTPTIREMNLLNGLNALLQKIEFSCGLAYGTISDVSYNEKTAEEIKASKQRSYSTVADTQKALRTALEELVGAMDVICTLYSLAPEGKVEASFEFDDSIVADRKSEFAEKMQLVTMGIMQGWEMRMWYFGETEEEAKSRALFSQISEGEGDE